MALTYKRRSAEELKKLATAPSGNFIGFVSDKFAIFTPAKGDNWIRILPPSSPDMDHYGYTVIVHYGVGPDGGSVLCINRMHGKKCPICEARAKMTDEEEAKELRPTKRVVMYVVDMKDPEKGVLVWSCPQTVDTELLKLAEDPRTKEVYYIDDPNEGYDITFEKTGERKNVKYISLRIARDPSRVAKKYMRFIEENPLPDVLINRSYKEVADIFSGGVNDDEDDAPRKSRARDAVDDDEIPWKSMSKKRPVNEEDDEDEDDRPARKTKSKRVEEDDDEDERPARKARASRDHDDAVSEEDTPARKTKAKRQVEEDDEEEDDKPVSRKKTSRPAEDDDEDDDDRPVTKRKKPARDEDDEDDEPPARAKSRKASSVDEDEEDEDEDDAPPARRKVASVDDDESPRAKLKKKLAERKR